MISNNENSLLFDKKDIQLTKEDIDIKKAETFQDKLHDIFQELIDNPSFKDNLVKVLTDPEYANSLSPLLKQLIEIENSRELQEKEAIKPWSLEDSRFFAKTVIHEVLEIEEKKKS